MSNPTTKVVNLADVPHVRSDGFSAGYCNHTEAAPGFYEITLNFGQITRDAEGNPVIEQHASIAMTWEHAMLLKELLDRQIEGYEQENGKLRRAKEVTPPSDQPAKTNLSQP